MIKVELDSPAPLEQQIYQELRHAIATGQVTAGDPLPSVRQLAGDLGVHWNTVARAYRRLGEDGLVGIHRGRGVVVKRRQERRATAASGGARESVQKKLREALTEAHLAGLSLDDVRLWFREQAAALPFRKDRS